ncbi:Hypothetical predicted protein [Cloeon dipterum]|uniref:DUF4758 domain-containing protein n=1 Tax=Cloeon dipterum TaxID=197152 RepID=A0A8S1DYE6_9INSE|nr:Hypothetical predicted protein [Cloeon dipterum]
MLVTAFLLWGCLHAVVAAPEVELITEPRAGEEYVFFKAAVSGRNPSVEIVNKTTTTTAAPQTTITDDETTVPTTFQTDAYETSDTELPTESKEEVQTEVSVVISKEMHINGRIFKQEQQKKMENVKIVPDNHESSQNKEEAASEVIEFKSEAEIGLLNRPSFEGKRGDTFTVPSGKFQSIDKSQHTAAVSNLPDLPPFNILSTGSRKPSEGHDIIAKGTSSHLPLQAAGTQTQSSRINVKKAANGQEYEYEYIYYYDDDEANPEGESIDLEEDLSKPASSTTSTTSTTTTTTTESPQEYIPEPIPDRNQHLRKEDDRYTTINRVRGHHRAEPVEYHTEVPFVNEINTPIRHSGRQHTLPEVEEQPEEERLPVATRFPPRGGHQIESISSGRVRPSLELVDSKSFRTGAAASAENSNSGAGSRFNSAAVTEEIAIPHREETFVPPAKTRVRSTTTTSTSTTTTTTTTTTTEAPEVESTEAPATDKPSKPAYDLAALYANIQSADDERANEVVETAQADDVTTEEVEETTVPETTVLPSSTTTTTTTTTEAPTTTETRTRSRLRPSAGGSLRKPISQNRSRKLTTEAPATAAPQVKPSQSLAGRSRNRQRGYSSSFSTAAPEEEVVKDSAAPVANAAPSFATKTRTNSIKNAIHRPNFPRRRGPPSRTPTPTAAEEKPEEETPAEGEPINVELAPSAPSVTSTTSTTTAKPRAIANRPRSPALLLRGRNRVGLPTTTAAPATSEQSSEEASAPEAPVEASSEASQSPQEDSTQAQSSTAAPTGLNRLRKRPAALVVTEKPKKPVAAQSPVSRRQLLARPRRPGPLTPSTPEPKASTESEVSATNSEETAEVSSPEVEASPSSTTTSTAAPEAQTTESLVSSLIKKRAGRKPGHFRSRGSASE